MIADYLPTPKNGHVANFLSEQGFERGSDGRYRRNLGLAPAAPDGEFPIKIAYFERAPRERVAEAV